MYPSLAVAFPDLVYQTFDPADVAGLDLVFLGLPHQASLDLAPQLVGRVGCVVDLSAAYRLKHAAHYPTYYGFEHDQPELLTEAVFGLPEFHRDELKGARLVATPGCHVTAAVMAVRPLIEAELVDARVIVNTLTGVTGAGRNPTDTNVYANIDSNAMAYGLLHHRHTPEIEQETGATVLFTPHLVPMSRGILATCYAAPTSTTTSTGQVVDALRAAYRDEPFVAVTDAPPTTKATLGSNAVHVSARSDERTGSVVMMAAIDNLAKGASGGAVQAANVALGIDETAGLTTVGVAP